MKLDRTITNGRRGKFDLIRNRVVDDLNSKDQLTAKAALAVLKRLGVLDDSVVGDPGEFFVLRLRDKYAADALAAYAAAALPDDPEYAQEIADMAARAGTNSPHCKAPD